MFNNIGCILFDVRFVCYIWHFLDDLFQENYEQSSDDTKEILENWKDLTLKIKI
jgi:hypothetical protein